MLESISLARWAIINKPNLRPVKEAALERLFYLL